MVSNELLKPLLEQLDELQKMNYGFQQMLDKKVVVNKLIRS